MRSLALRPRVAIGVLLTALVFVPFASAEAAAIQEGGSPAPFVRLGSPQAAVAGSETREQPGRKSLSLAGADLNRDGAPDLVAGFVLPSGRGRLAIYEGNPDAMNPSTPEQRVGLSENRYPQPFARTRFVDVPDRPDFLVLGDFDHDGSLDIVLAARGAASLQFLRGNGDLTFGAAVKIDLGGPVAALAAHEPSWAGGTLLAVALSTDNGRGQLLVYPARTGVLEKGVTVPLDGRPSLVSVGFLEGEQGLNVAVGLEKGLAVFNVESRRLETIDLPSPATAIAVGRFLWDREGRNELAVLSADGALRMFAKGGLDRRPMTQDDIVSAIRARNRDRKISEKLIQSYRKRLSEAGYDPAPQARAARTASEGWLLVETRTVSQPVASTAAGAPLLLPAKLDGKPTQDLLVYDAARKQFQVIGGETDPLATHLKRATSPEAVSLLRNSSPTPARPAAFSLDVDGPVAAVAQRVNIIPHQGLVFLPSGKTAPVVIQPLAAATYTVDRTDDNAGASACTAAANDCSLRGAVFAANRNSGPNTIVVPAGTYTLTLGPGDDDNTNPGVEVSGDLDFLSATGTGAPYFDNTTFIVQGAGAASTIIQAAATAGSGIDRIFDVDPPFGGGMLTLSVQGLTARYGKARSVSAVGGDGGAIRFIGQDFGVSSTTLTLSGAWMDSNASTAGPGGGVEAYGAVSCNGCSFTGNTATDGSGGGLALFSNAGTANSLLNATFSTNTAASATLTPSGGGLLVSPASNTASFNMDGSTVQSNTAKQDGGGISISGAAGAPVSIQRTRIASNTATNGSGGGVNNSSSAALTMTYCAVAGNLAGVAASKGLRYTGASNNVVNNWWACNTDPATLPCSAVSGTGAATSSPYMMLRNVASPTSVNPNGSAGLTAGFTINSASATIPAGNFGAFTGAPVTWSATNGSISGSQPTIQSSGTATATFTNSNTCSAGTATATVDTVGAIANIGANCPDLTITKTNDVAGSTVFGNTWTWTFTIANAGAAPASFSAAQRLVVDQLPLSGLTYGTPVFQTASNVTGAPFISCSISAAVLTCTATGTVTIGAPGSFVITLAATSTAIGTYANPRPAGTCAVDPDPVVTETNEANNACSNTVIVNKANTTTAILSDPTNPSVVGQPYTVTISVAAVAPGVGSPTGTVTISDGTGASCVVSLPSSSCALTSTTVGVKSLVATYNGDPNFNSSSSAASSHTVNQASTTTSITNLGALVSTPTVVGQSYAVNWSVTVNAPGSVGAPLTGNVTVSDGTASCTAAVSAGTCNLASTTAGLKTISASYAGDSNYGASVTATGSHTVNKADTTTTITNAASLASTPTLVGQSYAVNWSVTVNAPGAVGAALTGNVTVSDGTDSCTAAVSAGTCNLTSTTQGAKTITATYAGDVNYNGSTSAGASHTVNKPSTTTVITNAASLASTPTVVGQSYAVNVSVSVDPPATGTPTGTINVSDGSGATCSITLSAGSGTCNLTSTSVGAPKTITATYGGDANVNGGTGTASHTVNKANTSLSSLTDAPDPSVVGQPYTAGFVLSVTAPGAGTPTGTVSVNDGAGGSCTATLPATSCLLTSLVAGNKTVTFTYNGDASFNTSTNTAGHAVNKANTTVAITNDTPDPSVLGQNYAVTASVTVTSPGSGTPTGTITVTDGTNNCTITLPATSCNLPSTSVGAKTLTATYNGDANFNGSGPSAGASHTVNKADATTTITSDNPDPSAVGQNVTVAFTVAATPPGAGTPTGSVTVTVSGGAETCTGALAAGAGSCVLALTVPGSRTLTATYAGDANFNSSTDPEPHTVVAPPVVAKSFSPSGIALNGTAQMTFTITNPAANTVSLTGVGLVDNLPAGMAFASPAVVATTNCGGLVVTDGGGLSLGAGDTAILLNNATVVSGSPCVVVTNVTATTAGAKVNTTDPVTSTNGGTGNSASATLLVASPPTVAKSFSPAQIPVGGTSTLTIGFTNPNTISLSGLAITDSFPAGMQVAATPAATNSCGGTFSPTAGATSVSLSGGSLTASGSCSITVTVTGTTAGVKVNTTGTVSTTESGPGLTATANLTVVAPPLISKTFISPSIPLNGISTLTVTMTNPAANAVALTGISVSDAFPAGMQVAATPSATNSCGGTFTPAAGATTVSLSGGVIATPGATCTFTVSVTGTTAGTKNNTTGNVSSNEGGTGSTASATLTVVAPPTIAKSFSPTTIALNGTTTLTLTITNPAANTVALTGVGVVDSFPAGLEVAPTPGATNTCGGTFAPTAAATSITLSGGTVAVNSSCTVTVSVRGTTSGVKNNTTNAVTSTNGGTGNVGAASVTVASPPTVVKSFSPTQIRVGGTSTLTIGFTNPNTIGLTGLAITDSFPAGMQVAATPAATNTCGGTFAPTAGATSLTLSGGSLTASGSCSITVAVTGTTPGVKVNTTGTVSSTESGPGLTATANLTVVAPPTITKGFSPAQIPLNGTSTLTITITNPAGNTVGLTGVSVSDSFPAGMQVAATPAATNTCGGTFAPVAGATNISLSGGAIATPGSSCAVSVAVTGTTAGAKLNTTGNVSSTEGGTGLTASATLTVVAPPTIAKAFAPNRILLNQTSTLTITITNPAANTVGLTGISVTDAFPSGVSVGATPAATNTCGGTFTPTAGATIITLSGGAIATPGASCSVSVVVTGTTSGDKTNVTGNVTSTEGGTGGTATAVLTVVPPPTAVVSGTATICAGQNTVITAVLTGATPWTVTWSDGYVQTVAASPATRTVSPTFNTTYTVTSLTDANYSNITTGLTGSAVITVKPTPSSVITSASSVCSGSTGNAASVPDAGPGATYLWSVAGGTATSALNTTSITFTAGASGNVTLTVTVTLNGCPSTGTKTVTIDQIPTAPVPTAPANGSTYQGSHVSWTHPGNAVYDVYFDTVTPPQRLLAKGLVNNFEAAIPVWFPGVTYYWQVVARNACGQTASAVQTFTAGSCAWSGQAPVLIAPIANATNQNTATTLQWTSVPGAARYDIYLGTTSTNVTLYRTIPSPQLSTTVRLAGGKTYYWKVVATPVCGASGAASSATQSFTTAGNGFTLTAVTPAFVNRWQSGQELSVTGSGFLATSRVFTEYQGRPAGTLTPSIFTNSFSTSTNLFETLTPEAQASAARYDVGVTDAGIEEGRLLQSLALRVFTDVTEADWYFESSGRIADAGVMESDIDPATSGPQFWPNATVTRAQMAEYLSKAYQWWRTRSTALPPASCTTPDFPDVPCSHPNWLAIHWIKAWGVTNGAPCQTGGGNCYYPNNTVNRAEMVTFLERLRQGTVLPSLLSTVGQTDPGCGVAYPGCIGWADLPSTGAIQWPRAEMNVAYADRLTNGCGGTLGSLYACPSDPVTRAQIGAFLARLVGLVPTP